MRRRLCEKLEARRDGMVAALWANSNYDGDGKGESPRQAVIEEIEASFDEAIKRVKDPSYVPEPDEEDIDFDNNPFFAPVKRAMEARGVNMDTDKSVGEVVQFKKHIDQ